MQSYYHKIESYTFNEFEKRCAELGMRAYEPHLFSEWSKMEIYGRQLQDTYSILLFAINLFHFQFKSL